MKVSSFIVLGLCALTLIGCSGGKYYQSQAMDSQIDGDVYHFHNAVQLNLPATMFHATQSMTWMEMCKTKIDHPVTEQEFLYPFKDCVRDDRYQLTTMGSVASQFVTPTLSTAMYAGAIAYAGHQIGRGLGKSGDHVTQQGGGAQSDATGGSVNSGNKTVNVKPQTNINSGNKIIAK